jgi:hypothetical protein
MATPTEYDVPKCAEGVFGCNRGVDGHWTHTMNGTWTVADMRPDRSRTGEPEPANATSESNRPVVESPWSQFASDCPRC